MIVRLLDNDTLKPIPTSLGDGLIDNVYDVKIKQGINSVYQVSLKLTPSEDAWKVQFPNIVEIDNEYFRVMQLSKSRSNNIDISVDLEHISYELNKLALLEDGYKDRFDTEVIYSGTLSSVLTRILRGKRFTFDVSTDINVQDFITSTIPIRTRLNELAKFIGWEIEYRRFNISFKNRVGSSNGLVLEVGKNIRSLDYVITTDIGDNLSTALDVSVLDLSQIANPEELHQIRLGDTLRVLDPQLNVNQLERVVSLEYDPFQKALPNIEIENVIADTATASTLSQSGATTVILNEDSVIEDVVIRNNRTQVLNSQIFVVRETYFDTSTTFSIKSTSNGLLNAYFVIDGIEVPSIYRKTIDTGWDTISISKLIFGVLPGRKSLNLLLTFEGTGTCTVKYAQLITRSTGVIGGIDNSSPDRSVLDSFVFGGDSSPLPMIETSVNVDVEIPINVNITDEFELNPTTILGTPMDRVTVVVRDV